MRRSPTPCQTRALGLLCAGLGVVFPAFARAPGLWCGLALLDA
jgi:hypothetical protein